MFRFVALYSLNENMPYLPMSSLGLWGIFLFFFDLLITSQETHPLAEPHPITRSLSPLPETLFIPRDRPFRLAWKVNYCNWIYIYRPGQPNSQYVNFRIFLPFTFHVESILVILKHQKLPFWPFEQLWNLIFWEFLTFPSVKFFQKWKFKARKIVKTAVFDLLKSAKIDPK